MKYLLKAHKVYRSPDYRIVPIILYSKSTIFLKGFQIYISALILLIKQRLLVYKKNKNLQF